MSEGAAGRAAAGFVFSLDELARVLGGELEGIPGTPVLAYAVDSREVAPGSAFFALAGARTDGHRFLADVQASGAAVAVVRRGAGLPPGLAAIRVDDPAAALARLGREFRERWPLRVVGITGSAGKTTTKEIAAELLGARRPVLKSEGNLNTTVGLPLTLSRREPGHEVAVLELGMSFPGELRQVAEIARPDVAVITNVGLAHVGNFRSADDVARAKAEILEGLAEGGVFVANADDARVMAMAAPRAARRITFGERADADVRAREARPLGTDGTRVVVACGGREGSALLPLVGAHQVRNLLAALAAAWGLGHHPLELLPEVERLRPAPHRGRLLRLGGDVLVLDDCYNANPAAVLAALDALASLPGRRRVAVLGDMLELGAWSEVSHREAGGHAALRADAVLGVGPESAALVEEAIATGCREVQHVPDAATAAAVAAALVRDGDAVLVKGSRGIGLEAVVTALQRTRGEAAGPG